MQPDFKPALGETAEGKRNRLAAKKAYEKAQSDARRQQMEDEAKARLAERRLTMPAIMFELMLLAAEYHVPATVCLVDPQRSYSDNQHPGVQFCFDDRCTTYLTILAEEWEVEQVREEFVKLQEQRDEEARQVALRASGRAKLLSALDPEELAALGLK